MLLAVDIGNTNISLGLINNSGRIVRQYSTPTGSKKLKSLLAKINKINRVDKIIVVSVVPKVLGSVRRSLKKYFRNSKILVVGGNVRVPLKCVYNKKEIGQDRLVTAFAAKSLYGLPVLIVDFGTAVTFDCISKKGVYLGGLILPGIKMSLESLSERTAMLPKTYLKKTASFIGKSTKESIRGGLIYGYSSICGGMIDLFKRRVDKRIKVVATGGDAPLISKYTPTLKRVNLDLSLKGLYLLAKQKKI